MILTKQTFQILLSLTFLFFVSNQLQAQKCNYEVNEIDGLLEVPIKRTAPQLMCRIGSLAINVKAQCIGDNKYLKLSFFKDETFAMQTHREIAFILPSDDEITLYPREMPVDSTRIDDLTDLTELLVYKLSPYQYETLKYSPVVKFKYYLVSGYVEEEIKSSKQAIVMDLLRCVE